MLIKRIDKADVVYKAPEDWKQEDGSCGDLAVRHVETENGVFMVSAWAPTPKELEMLLDGETIKLWIRGTGHPVVAMTVGEVE